MVWIGLAMIIGGLGMAAYASYLQRKSEPHGDLERRSAQGDTPLMRAAIGTIVVGVALMGLVENLHR